MERSPRRRWSGSLLWVWQSVRTDAGRRQGSWAGTGIKPVIELTWPSLRSQFDFINVQEFHTNNWATRLQ